MVCARVCVRVCVQAERTAIESESYIQSVRRSGGGVRGRRDAGVRYAPREHERCSLHVLTRSRAQPVGGWPDAAAL